jgi:anti-sigma B factor antagonist
MESRTLECFVDQTGDIETGRVHTVLCKGQLVSSTGATLKETVKPLIDQGGRIIVDLGEVSYVDSMGLGTLVGLKASAIAHGYCSIEFNHLSDRVQQLLRLTHLTEMLKS